MQKFFISISYIPEQERPYIFGTIGANSCLEINLPDRCQHCNTPVVIGNIGDATHCGNLKSGISNGICDHFLMWDKLWANRITNITKSLSKNASVEVLYSLNDGCKCNKCGIFYSMAAPNQKDNTFKCYTCRNRGW